MLATDLAEVQVWENLLWIYYSEKCNFAQSQGGVVTLSIHLDVTVNPSRLCPSLPPDDNSQLSESDGDFY